MNYSISLRFAFALLASFAANCFAADGGPTMTISGFGTVALTSTDTDDAEFIRPNQAAGVRKSPRAGPDTNLGLQATAKFNNSWSATAQGLVRKNATDKFGAELALAFVKFKLNDDFSFRAGRLATPIYMISDFRNVGYANTMIRPPSEVYRQVANNSFDGADVVYTHGFGDTTLTVQFGAGNATTESPGSSKVVFKPLTSLHVVAENGPFTLRFGRADATFTVYENAPLNGLLAALRGVGLTQVAEDFKVTDVRGSFTSIGGTLDYKNFLVQTEYAVRKTESRAIMDTTSYYAMFGYRFGKVTPYYYYGNIKQDDPRTYAGLPTTGPLAGLAAAVNSVAKSALQSTNAIGVRWDFHKSAALKVQVDHVSPRDGNGAFINAKPAFKGPVNVYAVGIDFVF
ncbi:MAG: hypothetical protein V4631_11800 [Pseudomonadota bacterium]